MPPQPTEYLKYGPWLAEPRRPEFFQGNRVYSRKILGERQVVTLETTDSVADQQVYITLPKTDIPNAAYLAGILGSRLMAFFIQVYYNEVNDAFPQIKVGQLQTLPIPEILSSEMKAKHDQLVKLVEQMVSLNKRLAEMKVPHEKAVLQQQINVIDKQIDRLVYELYSLTEEEINMVEETFQT